MSSWGEMNAARARNTTDLLRLTSDIQGRRLDRRAQSIQGMSQNILDALARRRGMKFQAGEAEKERGWQTGEREAGQLYGTGERKAGQDFQLGSEAEKERRRLMMLKENPDLLTVLRDLERIMNPPSGEKPSEERLLDDPMAYLMNNWANWIASRQLVEKGFGEEGIAPGQWDAWKKNMAATFPDYATPQQRQKIMDAIDGFIEMMTAAGQAGPEPPEDVPALRNEVPPTPRSPSGGVGWQLDIMEGPPKEANPANVKAILDALEQVVPRNFWKGISGDSDRQYIRAIRSDLGDDNKLRSTSYAKLLELIQKYPVDVQLEYPKAQ